MDKQISYHAPADSAALSVSDRPPGEAATWKDFVALTKPGILRSNLIAVFAGFWLASQWQLDYLKLVLTLVGTVLIMASSCVFNNYFDRDLDTKMARTKNRALPIGKLSPRTVLWYAVILGITGAAVLFSFSGGLAGIFGLVGMFVYVIIYTLWLKRTSTWSTSIGAISGAMPPVIGYVAASGNIDLGALLIFALLFLWQPPHFWALGIRRVEEYRAAGFPLLPVVKGIPRTKLQMIPYLVLLIPIPILMYVFDYTGIWFLVIGTALSAAWLLMALKGISSKEEEANEIWAKKVFLFSVNYLTIALIVMILDTVRL
ncbi:protoheme IX farnesyltransferase [Paenibacillus faecis]|uniref:Protoheme IX farnesyltransferase n=1 Tax=Paenibacillus faecis TaxID=862114 RepID=A0A5D0CZG1_9BACL|nr:heme o synthase [Paenibacillus faecis]TYA15462.1 protoheme IX farnesyltransferase [Paenibacillus faecis]